MSHVRLQNMLHVLGNDTPDQDILHNALVGQGLASDRGGVVLQQPGLQSSPLIGEPISSYDRVLHDALQFQTSTLGSRSNPLCSCRTACTRYTWHVQKLVVSRDA